jgi:hypothetical protein
LETVVAFLVAIMICGGYWHLVPGSHECQPHCDAVVPCAGKPRLHRWPQRSPSEKDVMFSVSY